MHYNINNLCIKTEYAAKSFKQPCKVVLDFINTLPKNINVLDYGCGKLRYTIPLSQKASFVVSIDSPEQLDKLQMVGDCYTTVREYAEKNLSNVTVYDLKSQEWQLKYYDVILCTNVLSAIPDDITRLDLLINIKNRLAHNGFLFLCVQFRNSYYKQYSKKINAENYNDGWIIDYHNKSSFYGIIMPEKLENLCYTAGLEIFETYTRDGSIYLKAK
jgi:2-polyprenyl-3-methyl-5-hydroxy-6-metoxy-1,4-benzoquinol methylase